MRFEKNMEPDQKSCTAQQDGPHSERTPSIILMLPTHYLSKKRHYLFLKNKTEKEKRIQKEFK